MIKDTHIKAFQTHEKHTKTLQKVGKQSNWCKLFCALAKLGKDSFDCFFAGKDLKAILKHGINPNLLDVLNAVYAIYVDFKKKVGGRGGKISAVLSHLANALGGMYNGIVKLGRFIEAKCKFNMKAFFSGLLVCAKILMDVILLVVQFAEDIIPKGVLAVLPLVSVALSLCTLIQAFVDVVQKMRHNETVSITQWVSVCCSIGSFLCSVVGMACMLFPGMGTAMAAAFRALQIVFDTLPTLAEIIEWLTKNGDKVLNAVKTIIVPVRAGHAICKGIRDKFIGHDIGRRDNQCTIYNQLDKRDLTVYTYNQFDIWGPTSVAYWEEKVKPNGKICMAAGQEPNQPFKVQFEHPQITSWTGSLYVGVI